MSPSLHDSPRVASCDPRVLCGDLVELILLGLNSVFNQLAPFII
jgi:hypothetical protein